MTEIMAQPLQPELVKSIEDDDNSSSMSPSNNNSSSEKALEYLLRYETMVRQQDAEDVATLAHLRPLLYRIEKLGGKEDESKDTPPQDMEDIMAREVTFSQLQKALQVLDNDSSHVMTTDRQLMLVLRTLAKKSAEDDDACISWAEFYQCYKTVVAGMQTLQYVPSQSLVRSRTKDRTLTILSMFEPPSTKLFNEEIPRSIQTNDALEGDRHYIMPELRKQRRKAIMLFCFFMAMAVLVFGVFFESPHINNGKPMIDVHDVLDHVNQAMQAAKTAVAPWWPEHLSTSVTPDVGDSFFHHIHSSIVADDAPTSTSSAKAIASSQESDNDVNAAVAVLAGASGVALAPVLIKMATALLQAGGLPAMGTVTIITAVAAPVIKGVDIVLGRVLRAVGIGKKKAASK